VILVGLDADKGLRGERELRQTSGNALAERFVRSIREEWLDQLLILVGLAQLG
jgi:hypothetical protein